MKINLNSAILIFTILISNYSSTAFAVDAVSDQSTNMRERVVFQVSDNDPKKWNLALNNAKNVQEGLGVYKVDIEIVTYGPGVEMLKFDTLVGNRVNEAITSGINIVACQNTMKHMGLSKSDMLTSIGYVPAGVIELIKKQREGWAYIRP